VATIGQQETVIGASDFVPNINRPSHLMKIYTSKTSLMFELGLSLVVFIPGFLMLIFVVEQIIRGFSGSIFIVALTFFILAIMLILPIHFALPVFIMGKLAHLPVLDFSEEFVTCRNPRSTTTFDIPYEQIASIVITENASKFSPSMLIVTQLDGNKISIDPTFIGQKKLLMEQFEKHCSFLRRRYEWQWANLYRTNTVVDHV
jgi:hypothetical protein